MQDNKLLIYTTGTVFWHRHNDVLLTDLLISDFDVSINKNFTIVENDGANSYQYSVQNVSIKVENGSIETGFDRFSLEARLRQLNYTPFLKNNLLSNIKPFLEITKITSDGQTNFNTQSNLVVRQVLLDRIELLQGDFTYNATSGVLSIINADLLPLEAGNIIRVRQF